MYAYPLSSFSPSVNNAACSCVSYVYTNVDTAPDQYGCAPGASCTMYSFADASMLSMMTSTPSYYTNVQSCTTNLCNCNEPGCVDPYTPGACPTTGSAGPLKCRIGYIGTMQGTTYSLATPGNLVTQTFPTGSICFKYTYNGLTIYTNQTAATCVDFIRLSGMSGGMYTAASGCNTDLCGAPVPTWASSGAAPTEVQVLVLFAAAIGVFVLL